MGWWYMSRNRLEPEVDEFYGRWSRQIFTYCRLFLGNRDQAEIATEEAFTRFLSQSPDLSGNRLSLALVRCAWEAAGSHCVSSSPGPAEVEELTDARPLLPCEQRSVFILRSVLGLRAEAVAVATLRTPQQVNQIWVQSLLRIRKLWLKRG